MRTIKTYLMIAFASLALVFSQPALAKKKQKLSYGETVALASANLISRYETVGQFIKIFKPHMTAKEYRGFKKTLGKHNISLKEKLPRVKARGNKLLVSQAGYIQIKNAKAMVINGHKFRGSQKDISTRFEEIYSKIAKKKKSKVSVMSMIVPEAHAFGDMMGLLATFGAGFAGYVMGPKLGIGAGTGALLGAGGLYLATEAWQSWKSGDITCTADGKYQQRSKDRNMWFMAMEKQTLAHPDKIKEAGLSENCTENNAKALQAWSEGSRSVTSSSQSAQPQPNSYYGESIN